MSPTWRVWSLRGATSLILAMVACLAVSSAASARAVAPRLRGVDCWPRHCAALRVAAGGSLRVTADRLGAKNYVVFAVTGRRVRAVRATRRSARRLIVRVPPNAVTGRVRVQVTRRPQSRASRRITVVRPLAKPSPLPKGSAAAFAGNAMWIWVLSRSDGGNASAIVARARAAGIGTVFVKAADGTNLWQQFSPGLLSALKGAGLRVCGWQYVYGTNPAGEAATAAQAIALGADCFIIDAESEFEGRYAQAQTYMAKLRARTGAAYPLGLSSFPYVDYHPSFPYSVFLGPGGAQANLPQMYWKAIGTSVDQAFAHTWPLNRVYGAPVFPVGQTYQSPSTAELLRFRSLAAAYGSTGVSWWDWQETSPAGWNALAAAPPPSATPSAASSWPSLGAGSRGDLVVWAQEHLNGAGYRVSVDGSFGATTRDALTRFQAASGLGQTGRLDGASWPALLRAPVAQAAWAAASSPRAASGSAAARRPHRAEIPVLGRGG